MNRYVESLQISWKCCFVSCDALTRRDRTKVVVLGNRWIRRVAESRTCVTTARGARLITSGANGGAVRLTTRVEGRDGG